MEEQKEIKVPKEGQPEFAPFEVLLKKPFKTGFYLGLGFIAAQVIGGLATAGLGIIGTLLGLLGLKFL